MFGLDVLKDAHKQYLKETVHLLFGEYPSWILGSLQRNTTLFRNNGFRLAVSSRYSYLKGLTSLSAAQ